MAQDRQAAGPYTAADPAGGRVGAPSGSGWPLPALAFGVVLAGGVAVAGFQGWLARTYVAPHFQQAGRRFPPPDVVAVQEQAKQLLFVEQQAGPLLRKTAEKNREALARASDNLGRNVDAYRAEIEPFIADLRSWGTQRRSFTLWLSGWWHGDQRLEAYIDAKFRKHLFTEATIAGHVANALAELRDDIRANENQLLVELREASAKSRLTPPPIWFDRTDFSDGIARRAMDASGAQPHDQVARNVFIFMGTAAVATTVLPDAMTAAVRGIVGAAVTRTGALVAADVGLAAADIGGSTAAGSEVPLIGNAVGFCIGMVSAIVIQHFSQEVQDEKLRAGLNDYIDGLKASLVGGNAGEGELAAVMRDYVAQVDAAEADLVRSQALRLTSEQ